MFDRNIKIQKKNDITGLDNERLVHQTKFNLLRNLLRKRISLNLFCKDGFLKHFWDCFPSLGPISPFGPSVYNFGF